MEAKKKKQLKENLVGVWFALTMVIMCCEPVSESLWPVVVWGLIIVLNMAGVAYAANKMKMPDDDDSSI